MHFSVEGPVTGAIAVWDDSSAFTLLDRLIARANEAGHEVMLREADLILASGWASGARAETGNQVLELCELARASAWGTTPTDTHPVSSQVEAKRALRIANSPLKIVVESALRDGALLEAVVRLSAMPELQQLWLQPPMPPVIEVVHAGGCGDMLSIWRREKESALVAGLPVRMIIICDSDRPSQGAQVSDEALRLKHEVGNGAVILSKREAENYLPDIHWRAEIERDPCNPNWTGKRDIGNSRGSIF